MLVLVLWCMLMPACQLRVGLIWLCPWLTIWGKAVVSFWPLAVFRSCFLPFILNSLSSQPDFLSLRPASEAWLSFSSLLLMDDLSWLALNGFWLAPPGDSILNMHASAPDYSPSPAWGLSQVHLPCTWLQYGLPVFTFACGPFSTWNSLFGIFYLLLTHFQFLFGLSIWTCELGCWPCMGSHTAPCSPTLSTCQIPSRRSLTIRERLESSLQAGSRC